MINRSKCVYQCDIGRKWHENGDVKAQITSELTERSSVDKVQTNYAMVLEKKIWSDPINGNFMFFFWITVLFEMKVNAVLGVLLPSSYRWGTLVRREKDSWANNVTIIFKTHFDFIFHFLHSFVSSKSGMISLASSNKNHSKWSTRKHTCVVLIPHCSMFPNWKVKETKNGKLGQENQFYSWFIDNFCCFQTN